ncbi:hypothetical protein B0H19DRAFT_1266704 [Mycena capillaripes]|nr:hypothetical protein B0H19DRAFT_1266704 [Mycena capillaripes]
MSATILMLACAVLGNIPTVPHPLIRRVLFTHQVHALVRTYTHSGRRTLGCRVEGFAHQVQVRSELAAQGRILPRVSPSDPVARGARAPLDCSRCGKSRL